jgi:uncharacterized protein (TIGR04255 family)
MSTLPEFSNPPVSEVAISVTFIPLANWHGPHAGVYWGQINGRYPHTEVHPAIANATETFDGTLKPRSVALQIVDADAQRFWFLADPPNELIQLQRDRFVINWRKVSGDEKYPRFANNLRPRFEKEWAEFKEFLSKRRLGTPAVQLCEVTYVNDFVQGESWTAREDALKLFSAWWSKRAEGFLPLPETLSLSGTFLFPARNGRLHFSVGHVLRNIDNREGVQLQLICRVKPNSEKDADILAAIDLAHEWVVKGFADMTSDYAHKIWGRTK